MIPNSNILKVVGHSEAGLLERSLYGAVPGFGSMGVHTVDWQTVFLHDHIAIRLENQLDHGVERNLGVRQVLHPPP